MNGNMTNGIATKNKKTILYAIRDDFSKDKWALLASILLAATTLYLVVDLFRLLPCAAP